MESQAVKTDSSGRTIYSVESRSSIEVDLDIIMKDGQLPIFREVEDRGLLSLRFQRSKVIIAAGGFIGLIPLSPSITIDVRPKLPVRNLARVLEVARAPLTPLANADRYYLATEAPIPSILEFLGRNLVSAMRDIDVHGMHKEYVGQTHSTSQPSGRIDLSSSLQRHWSRGQLHCVVSSRFDLSSNLPVNRVIKAALIFLLQRLQLGQASGELIAEGNGALLRIPSSITEASTADIEHAGAVLRRGSLPIQRDYYYRALEISLLILSNGGIALQEEGSDVLLRSFVVNFDDLFESYVRRILQSASTNDIRVFDGNTERRKYLFQNTKVHYAQPDIVVSSGHSLKTVVSDVKYKDSPKREDINQVVTYAVSYGTNQTVIIHQAKPGTGSGLRHIGRMGTISVDAYGLDLDSADLPSEEAKMVDIIFGMVA
ncbi:hypothetical protein HFO21_16475 [Rhizobium laguerreae]|uniref:McrC family protein n=1 Tax=Rhizobium laguerreae TaxID=1076926 RepID=UPI001C92AB36|nr:McrC family protein [Rhizobium laguerreae]MBY3215937.1 hypothetical protein [Rhizobium laguerreae]